jgi:hypothetical protein
MIRSPLKSLAILAALAGAGPGTPAAKLDARRAARGHLLNLPKLPVNCPERFRIHPGWRAASKQRTWIKLRARRRANGRYA